MSVFRYRLVVGWGGAVVSIQMEVKTEQSSKDMTDVGHVNISLISKVTCDTTWM